MSRAHALKAVPIALAAALVAGAGHAEVSTPFVARPGAISLAPVAQKPLDLSVPAALSYARRAPTPLPRGVARTSVEHQSSDFTTGAGLLCGVQPSADTSGAAMARGYDPDGKFVGAKLALRF